MSRRIARQDGWALLTALVMLTLLVLIGLAAFAYVGRQTTSSSLERTRESSFNLDEAVLRELGYVLVNRFPESATFAYPDCSWSTGAAAATRTGGSANSSCLSPSAVSPVFASNPDFATGVTWTTRVRDNWGTQPCQQGGGGNCSYYYDDSSSTAQAFPSCSAAANCYSYDANGDDEVWVRASATIRGKVHTVVQLVRVDKHPVTMPNTALTAGYVDFQNKHTFVFPGDASVDMRCDPNDSSCIDPTHVQPSGGIVYNYPSASVLSRGDVAALAARAQQEGSYYNDCPTNPPGSLVVVYGSSSTQCGWSSLPATSPTSFATYIQLNGSLRLNGTNQYYGLIYLGNSSIPPYVNGVPLTSYVYYDNGNSDISGSIIVDGQGGAHIGNGAHSGLSFDSRAFTNLWSYGNQNAVKGTFREIKAAG